MNINIVVLASFFLTVTKLVSSAPADPTSTPTPPPSTTDASCIVPLVILTTLDKPFTLSASATLNTGLVVVPSWWPVQLDPPSNTVETQLFISQTRIAPPQFRLTGGILTTIGRGGIDRTNAFSAHFGFKIQIFPPVPDPIYFGGPDDGYSGFQAGYACGHDGKAYLELRAGEC